MTEQLTTSELAAFHARAREIEKAKGYTPPGLTLKRDIDFIDVVPKPFIVQIPLVDYFERIKRLKADRWQHDFCGRLQTAIEHRHERRTMAIIHAEAQLGKSVILAQIYNAWLLGHDPLHQIALATYNVTRSQRHSKTVIGIMQSNVHKDIFPNKDGWLRERVSKEKWSTEARIQLNDGQDSFNPVGLQSGLTGNRFDCFPAETKVTTEFGDVKIGELYQLKHLPKVYAFNHETQQVELCEVEALREILADELIEFTTASGRTIRSTTNHRFFINGQYVRADQIRAGDFVSRLSGTQRSMEQAMLKLRLGITTCESERASLAQMRLRESEGPRKQRVSEVLGKSQRSQSDSAVLSVRGDLSGAAICREQKPETRRSRKNILFDEMPGALRSNPSHSASMQNLQRSNAGGEARQEVLRETMLGTAQQTDAHQKELSRVQGDVFAFAHSGKVLFTDVRECVSLAEYDGQGEFPVFDREKLRQVVSRNEASDFSARSLSMCELQSSREAEVNDATRETDVSLKPTSASYRSRPGEQFGDESSSAVWKLSYCSPQLVDDEIRMVRRIREGSVKVYDIQVARHSNFFANEILVHNCLLIDDPYADQREAFSSTVQQNLQETWEFTVVSRLGLHSNVFGMFHRYAVDDLAGYLLDKGMFDYWRYATQFNGDYIHAETGQRFGDPLDRQIGEYISPERRPPSYYLEARKNNRVWMSMFQGIPSAEEGEFFNVGKVATIDLTTATMRRAECSVLVRSWDLAATEAGGDYSVGTLGGMRSDGKFVKFGQVRKQVDSAGRDKLMRETAVMDGTDVIVTVPKDPGAAGNTTVFHVEQLLQGFQVATRGTSGSKTDRARNYSSAMNAGLVEYVKDDHLPEDYQWHKADKKEHRDFPLSLSSPDTVDSSADCYNECYERAMKGLVVKNFKAQRNLVEWADFADQFHVTDTQGTPDWHIPHHWQIYVGAKITPEANTPNSAVIVAKAAQNANMPDTLFVVAEYKAFTNDYALMFEWLDITLKTRCPNNEMTVCWLHKDSEQYRRAIQHKIGRVTRVFRGDDDAGLAETNWYFSPSGENPFNPMEKGAHIYGLRDSRIETEMQHFQQEAMTWGFDAKSEPSKVGAVLDCLRMITYQFRTAETPLTRSELAENSLDKPLQIDTIAAMPNSPAKDSVLMRRELALKEQHQRLSEPVRGAGVTRFRRR